MTSEVEERPRLITAGTGVNGLKGRAMCSRFPFTRKQLNLCYTNSKFIPKENDA